MKALLKIKQWCIRVYLQIRNVVENISRYYDSIFTPNPICLCRKSIFGDTLVIAPHADDELIGCYNYINRHKDNVIVLYCSLLGSNYNINNARVRREEFERFCHQIGVRYIVAGEFSTQLIIDVIRNNSINNVFVPSYIDWHKEHRMVNEYLLKALPDISINVVGWYQISIPIYRINYIEHESKKEFLDKWDSFYENYQSQIHINVARFKFVEKSNGNGAYAGEPYYIQTIEDFKKNVIKLFSIRDQMDKMKLFLNNYGRIAKMSASYYNLIEQ